MAHKNSAYHRTLAARISAFGWYTVRFDHVGCGESATAATSSFSGGGGGGDSRSEASEQVRNMMGGFWDDLADLASVVKQMQGPPHRMQVECLVGHSRGGQLVHMFGLRHAERLGIPRICGVNMRFDLGYWARMRREKAAANPGGWVLRWNNRGQPVKHTVTAADAEAYAAVPMLDVARIPSTVNVLNCYGVLGPGAGASGQASYDTGSAMLADGVVPWTDVSEPANLVQSHTLRFLPGVGHFFREDGAAEKLWVVLRQWIHDTGGSGASRSSL